MRPNPPQTARSPRRLAFAPVLAVALLAGGAVAAGTATLQQVQVTAGASPEIVLHLDTAAAGSAVSTFTLSGPERLVIDVADARANPEIREVAGDGAIVDRAEVITFDDGQGLISRVTLYLNRPADSLEARVNTEGNQVKVALAPRSAATDPVAAALGSAGGEVTTDAGTIAAAPDGRPPSGPERMPTGPAVASLDVQNLDTATRVVIGLQNLDGVTVTQPQPNLIVADAPGAFLPSSLTRPLDMSEFYSQVRSVRAYRTANGARVAISLRSAGTFRVVPGPNGYTFIDVDIPAELQQDRANAREGFAGVAPSASDSGIRSGTQQEIVIGETGRTSDPSAVWGTGAGADGPSARLCGASAMGADPSSSSAAPYSGRRISLDFVNADIHAIFRLISHVSRLNIVAGDDVDGRITVRMTDVPWDQALAAILQAKSLGGQCFGNIIRVAPIETIKAEQQARLEEFQARQTLTPLQTLIVPLNYMQASDLQGQIKSQLSARGSVEVDQAGNQLIVKDMPENLAQIREVVRHLDRETPQVLIEARIVEAASNYSKSLGIQWGMDLDASTRTGYSTGLFFPNNVGVSGGLARTRQTPAFYTPDANALMVDMGAEGARSAVAFNLGSIPGLVDLDARLSAMESEGWGKVVSTPKVTTLDNRPAEVSQGARIPFLSTSAGGTNVQFVQAALEMKVTPHITSEGKVFLNVVVTNNRADFSRLVLGNPTIQIKEVRTQLLVADGDTTVLGGVFSTEEGLSKNATPGLSKLPLLGYLFKNSTSTQSRNELIVFITPHVITKQTTTSTR